MKLTSMDKILELAIEKEEDAYQFYTDLAGKMQKPNMKKVFESFAKEEQGHKQKLIGLKQGKFVLPAMEKIQDLKIAEHVIDVTPAADLDFQEALILAMKAEKAAFKLYSDLAEASDDANTKNLFLALAQEEAKHKLRFEIEYDEYTYKDN